MIIWYWTFKLIFKYFGMKFCTFLQEPLNIININNWNEVIWTQYENDNRCIGALNGSYSLRWRERSLIHTSRERDTTPIVLSRWFIDPFRL